MAYGHGLDQILAITGSGHANNSTTISAYLTNINFGDVSAALAEVATLGDGWQERLSGLKDFSFDVEGIFDPAVGTLIQATVGGTASPFTYGPQGTTSGKPKITGSVITESYSHGGGTDDAVTFSASFAGSGTLTVGTY